MPDASHPEDPKACCKRCPPNGLCLIKRDVSLMLINHSSSQHVRFRRLALHMSICSNGFESTLMQTATRMTPTNSSWFLGGASVEGVAWCLHCAPNASTQTSLTCRPRRRLCGHTCRIRNNSMVSCSADTIFQIRQDTFCLKHTCLV